MQQRVLLTGFRPFGDLEINPTEQLMHTIAASAVGFSDAVVEPVVLDTDYVLCEQQFRDAVTRFTPDAILSFGVNMGVDELRLERIAHRLSTVMHADRIFVLERGQIVETGTHDELVREKGLYYAMWRQQVGEQEETGTGEIMDLCEGTELVCCVDFDLSLCRFACEIREE